MDDDRPSARSDALPVKTVQCSCGYVASAETADELLAEVEAHIAAAHAVEELAQIDDERQPRGWKRVRVKKSCTRERSEK
jgi:predicted small metal-binding protein